jgi:hypothetical protein
VRIARRYAKALADVLPDGKLERVGEEIKILISLLDDKAIRYFKSPVVSLEKKKALMEQILEKVGVSEELKKVLLLMAQKDRLGIVREFASEFERFVDLRLWIVKAESKTLVKRARNLIIILSLIIAIILAIGGRILFSLPGTTYIPTIVQYKSDALLCNDCVI